MVQGSTEALYAVVALLGGLAELVLLGVLIARRQYKSFPVFFTYIAFNIFSDVLVTALSAQQNPMVSMWAAFLLLPVQYLLELGVLLEIAWHMVRPVKASLPSGAAGVSTCFAVAAVAVGLLLAFHNGGGGSGLYERVKMPMDLAIGLLRMLLFAATVAFAQALGIGWRDRVLQLGAGLSSYSSIDLMASLAQGHYGRSGTADHLKGAAYLCELTFFIWAFTTKDVERHEFNPQMHQFLITMSERAREARSAMARSQVE